MNLLLDIAKASLVAFIIGLPFILYFAQMQP